MGDTPVSHCCRWPFKPWTSYTCGIFCSLEDGPREETCVALRDDQVWGQELLESGPDGEVYQVPHIHSSCHREGSDHMRAQVGPFQVGDPGVGVAVVYGWSCDNPHPTHQLSVAGETEPPQISLRKGGPLPHLTGKNRTAAALGTMVLTTQTEHAQGWLSASLALPRPWDRLDSGSSGSQASSLCGVRMQVTSV